MRRITVDPVLDIETMEWLPRPSFYVEDAEVPILFDRSVQNTSKKQAQTDQGVAGNYGNQAQQIGSSIIPGLEREANNPQGYDTSTVNNMETAGAQAAGGVNAGIGGIAGLEEGRTRNAGGATQALDEAARIKSRQLSNNALNVQNESAKLGQEKQQQAQQTLAGLYGTDTSNQLKAMGISNEDIANELKAGQQGWLQNTDQTLGDLGQIGSAGASAYKTYKGG
jgi:hypothetical protein